MLNVSFFLINFRIDKTFKLKIRLVEDKKKEVEENQDVANDQNPSVRKGQNYLNGSTQRNSVISIVEDEARNLRKSNSLPTRKQIRGIRKSSINRIDCSFHLPNQVSPDITQPKTSKNNQKEDKKNGDDDVIDIDENADSSVIESPESVDSAYASSNGTDNFKMESHQAILDSLHNESRQHISIVRSIMANTVLIFAIFLIFIVYRRTPKHMRNFIGLLLTSVIKLYRNFSTLLASMYCFEEISNLFNNVIRS